MMAKYEGSCGGHMLVSLESILLLQQNKESSGDPHHLDCVHNALQWLVTLCERKGTWLRVVPLRFSLLQIVTAHASHPSATRSTFPVIEGSNDNKDAPAGVLRLIHHIKTQLHHAKVMLVTGCEPLRAISATAEQSWVKPVVMATELLQKLGVTLKATGDSIQ
eukprot:CAMPEP_0176453070 /NCGR_PEP_ID=MMETSP0127-20121128/28982_1 /TAXON_ID=938130 /ORGANISM="Platyophrya macrostoma, Strain WH" /LENGTH=162 /DNA_ID=CAMNT_0017841785 /DNA_START=1 /DNA_END=489 /DNA_ORIENTATION=-